jgi:RNA polymerase sigma factor (sigma-70 family)
MVLHPSRSFLRASDSRGIAGNRRGSACAHVAPFEPRCRILSRFVARVRHGHQAVPFGKRGHDACTARMRALGARNDKVIQSGRWPVVLSTAAKSSACLRCSPFLQGSSHMSERELIVLVSSFLAKRTGNATADERHAWEEFFVTYDPILRASIRRIHAALPVLDDVAQDAWVVLIRRLPRWTCDPARAPIGVWVTEIARRLALKRARRRSRVQVAPLSDTHSQALVDPEPGPDTEFEWLQEHESFRALVSEFAAGLDDRTRRIVVMHWVQSCALSMIASDLSISLDAVWGAIRRARPKLIRHLRRNGLAPLESNVDQNEKKVQNSRR